MAYLRITIQSGATDILAGFPFGEGYIDQEYPGEEPGMPDVVIVSIPEADTSAAQEQFLNQSSAVISYAVGPDAPTA